MPKRTIALIVVLILITASLLYIALSPKKQPVVNKNTTSAPTPISVVTTKLMLSPNPVTVSSSSASVNVDVETGDNTITAVQLELTYDPKVLTNVNIALPSENGFINNPIEFVKKINPTEGKIYYSFGIIPTGAARKGAGTVAVITFTPLTKTGQTTIQFTPNTIVTAEGQTTTVLKETTGTTIMLTPVSSTTSAPLAPVQ